MCDWAERRGSNKCKEGVCGDAEERRVAGEGVRIDDGFHGGGGYGCVERDPEQR